MTQFTGKRDRVVFVCSFCKQAKRKCDRRQPCSTCKRRSIPCIYNLTKYETYSQSANVPIAFSRAKIYSLAHSNTSEESIPTRNPKHMDSAYEPFIGVNPHDGLTAINFYATHTNSAPLSWNCLMWKDRFTNHLWSKYLGTDIVTNTNDLIMAHKRPSDLKDEFRNILPTNSTVWDLIEWFFSWAYPFFPFMDETLLRSKTTLILQHGPESDYPWAGILLTILRLACLSKGEFTAKTIPLNAIDLAVKILLETKLNDDFATFLLSFHLKLYHKFSPEASRIHENEVNHHINKALISRARALGLHRSEFRNFGPGSKFIQQKI